MKITIYIFFLLMVAASGLAAITSDTPILDVEWTVGTTQPSPATITFTATAGETSTLDVSISGNATGIASVVPSSISFSNTTTTRTATVSYNLPSIAGLYRGRLNYGSNYIPIIISVLAVKKAEETSDCKLKPITGGDYVQTIKQNAPQFTQQFTVAVSKKCVGPVKITGILPQNTIQMEEGMKPIRLEGAISTGEKEPGEEVSFTVVFDVKGLLPAVYTPSVKVVGSNDDKTISTQINFQLTVTAGSSPATPLSLTPAYNVPDSINPGQSFDIVVSNIDQNFFPEIFPNTRLVGEKVERTESQWKWTGKANGTEDLTIDMVTKFQGGQIGPVFKKVVKMGAGSSLSQASTALRFDLYPKIEDLRDGTEVTVLTRDNVSSNIVESVLYLNGDKLTGTKFYVDQFKSYCLSAVASGYNTADLCFQLNPKSMKVSYSPSPGKPLEDVTFSVADVDTGNPINFTLTVEGVVVTNPHQFKEEREYLVDVAAGGYLPANVTVTISDPLRLVSSPEALIKRTNASLQLNKEAEWSVSYKKSVETEESLVLESGEGTSISFIPKKSGIYTVSVNGETFKEYVLAKPQGVGRNFFVVGGIILVIVIILMIILIVKGRRPRVGFGIPSQMSSEIITEEI